MWNQKVKWNVLGTRIILKLADSETYNAKKSLFGPNLGQKHNFKKVNFSYFFKLYIIRKRPDRTNMQK